MYVNTCKAESKTIAIKTFQNIRGPSMTIMEVAIEVTLGEIELHSLGSESLP